MAKTAFTVKVHAEGVRETLAAFRRLPKEASGELRKSARELVATLVPKIRAAAYAAPTPQASKVAPKVRPLSDRVPAIQATDPVKPRGIRGHGVLFGAEFGSNQFGQFHHAHTGREGLWFFPTVERDADDIVKAWRKAADAIIRDFTRPPHGSGGV